LRQAPLTFTPTATPSGGVDTLKIWVNDVRWDEAPTLFGLGPRDRAFTAHMGPDGKFIVQFGDGTTGARPPSGDENISATYRVGLGTAGNVKSNQLHVLLTRPLGVRSVSNPRPVSGGADPEDAADARQNVPYLVLTLDRIVSLHDYEDFARAFGGVAKARADWLWDGSHGVIFVTVVNADGKQMDADCLCAAIDTARDPAQLVRIGTKDALPFRIRARLVVDPHYLPEQVLNRSKTALGQAFSIKRRDFGQDVTESEVLGILQSVEGVVAADMEEPYPGSDQNGEWNEQRRLVAHLAYLDSGPLPRIVPAELWVLDKSPDAITLRVVSDLSEPVQRGGL
jgi:predicted phage baseplate assembly protein